MRSLIEYVQLFRTNDLVTDDIRMCTDENSVDGNENFNGNWDVNGQNYSERENEVNNENKNGDSTIRIFSWNGNKDLVVSLLPDLPLFPYSETEEVVAGKFLFLFSIYQIYLQGDIIDR